jgi:TPR repeat protein
MTVTPNANAKPNSMANQAQTENAPPDKSPKDASAVEPKDNSKAASAKNKPATDEDSSEESSEKDTSTVAANVRPSRPAVEKPKPEVRPPDPRQNKMLVQGENYLYGRGVRKSCQQALVYFRAAANEENAPAMSHLGAMYASGNCVPIDRRAAYKWFARAGSTDPSNQWIQRNLNMLWRDMSAEERASVSNQ